MQCQQRQQPEAAIDALRQEILRLEGVAYRAQRSAVSSGTAALDHVLPERGFRRGTVVEWLAAEEPLGSTTLAMRAARQACQDGGTLVVIDRRGDFYPPAAARLGIDLARMILLRPGTRSDHDWAMDQALRCGAVSAVVAWPDTQFGTLDGRTFRRWQLAAEAGGTLGLLLRPATVCSDPSWADVRLLIAPGGSGKPLRRLHLVLLRCRGGSDGQSLDVEIEDESYPVPMAARVVPAVASSRHVAG
jgi:protein ImuA